MRWNTETLQDIAGGIALFLLIILLCFFMTGCTPPDPNKKYDPITVQDVNGVCWEIHPVIAYEGFKTMYFLRKPCLK